MIGELFENHIAFDDRGKVKFHMRKIPNSTPGQWVMLKFIYKKRKLIKIRKRLIPKDKEMEAWNNRLSFFS